uniref:C-type lectin domain-containing protein n=1 Tax=Cyprinus carpio TaxID=7962 RepID=A0A8C1PUW8_CYPCA
FGFLFVSGFTVLQVVPGRRTLCTGQTCIAGCSGPDWYEFGEFCYKPFEEKKTWHSARTSYCLARGADLLSIHSPEEEIFLSSFSKGKTTWIGLSVNPVEGGYHWSDGTPVSHTNWGHGEPNNHNGRENCVEMVTTENGTSWWNDLNCDAHQDWICMIAKGKKPIIPPEPPSPAPGASAISYYQ